jgi:signal transduction histidine kinase/CheY-like chemotaxis protein
MSAATPMRDGPDERGAFLRVLRRRTRGHVMRAFEGGAIGLLAWLATHDLRIGLWVAAMLATGLVESWVGRRAFAATDPWTRRRSVTAAQFLSAVVFSGVAAALLAEPSAIRLAEAGLVLTAVSLGNAMKSSGSRYATWALVAPPATGVILAPLWVAFAGADVPVVDTLLLSLAGVGYIAFIIRLSAAMAAEREAVRVAGREAEAGNQRWRMVFHNSPMARICFDASALYARLQDAAHGRTRLGDVMLEAYQGRASLFEDVRMVEANGEARAMFARYGGAGAFGEDFLAAFAEALNEMDAEGVIPPFEATMGRHDGSSRIVRIHYRVTDANGAPWSLCLGAYDDVTEARLAAQAEADARLAAEEANRAKSDFLAVMSHEIRTPLNGVLGMAQAMDMEPLSPDQRERLAVIRESGGALLDLLDDLLDLSRIEAGRLTLDIHEFDLRGVVSAAHAAFGAQAATKELAFPLEIDPAVEGLWRGDAQRVRQLLTNLVSNGLKFTHVGEVAVRVTRSAAGVRIEVADTGIGIAPDRAPRLFEKFVQADASATRAYGGTGLGLSICQELCQAMGGVITVDSAPGAGSTFSLELPLRPVERSEPETRDLPAPLACGVRVLAAEDNAVNRMVLKALLGQLGVEPTLVENGEEAVRAWESSHWDVILMDVQMPVMDGPTATMTIRAREAVMNRPRTPILAVTANTMAHQVASYRAAGMDDVVSKPLNAAELLTAVANAAGAELDASETDLRAAS